MNPTPVPAPRAPQHTSTRPPATCPLHPEHQLEDGPIRYRCPLGHSVPAADLIREVTR